MSTINGLLTNVTKNAMLNSISEIPGGRVIFAANEANQERSDILTFSLNNASNGKVTLSSPVSLTIASGSVGANAIKKIFVENSSLTTTYISFELDVPLEFPDGGSLIISSLEISLDDPS